MNEKDNLALELDHAQDNLEAQLAIERARSEAILRGYIRAMEALLAALRQPPEREVRHDA